MERHVPGGPEQHDCTSLVSHTLGRVVSLVCLLLVSIHWLACFWCLLADPTQQVRGWLRGIDANITDINVMPDSWYTMYRQKFAAPGPDTAVVVYVQALYVTMAVFSAVGGDIHPANELETGVWALVISGSWVLFSSMIAYMSNLILESDVNWTEHKKKVETIKSYMRHRKIPKGLQARIEEYLDYLWTTQKGLDETDIMSLLPTTLQQQVSLFCNSRIISTVPLFKGVSSAVSAAIVMQLQPRIFVPDDLIVQRGAWGDEMFLIYRGVVKLVELSESTGVGVYLTDGDYFGEIAVLTGGRRMMSVRAVTYCHLYSLQQRLLEGILQQHPECINNLLINMMAAYANFEDIKAQIFALARKPSGVAPEAPPPAMAPMIKQEF